MLEKYYITKWDLWYHVIKRKNGLIYYLSKNNKRDLNKENAITYFHLEDAKSTLVVMRIKDEWKKSH